MGKRYSEADKVRAWEMHCNGHTYQEIADAIGCSIDLIKRNWSKKWKERKAEVVEKVRAAEENSVTVAVQRHQLEHLMEARKNYRMLAEKVVEKLEEGDTNGLLAYAREAREWLKLSSTLEGVEPPQKNLNINVHTDMKSLKERMKQYEGLFDG